MAEEKNGKIVSTGKTTCACGPGCACGCGQHCVRLVFWVILGIIVLVVVFWMGVKLGEFRDELRSAFGGYYHHDYPMMQHGYGGGAMPVTGGGQGSATGTLGNVPIIPVQQ